MDKCSDNLKKLLGHNLTFLAISEVSRGNLKMALEFAMYASEIYEKINDINGLCNVLMNMEAYYYHLGRLNDVRKSLTRIRKLALEANDHISYVRALIGEGNYFYVRGQVIKAKNYLEKICSILEDVPKSPIHWICWDPYSMVLFTIGEINNAIYWGEKALNLAEELDMESYVVRSMINLGEILFLTKNDSSLIEEAFNRSKDLNDFGRKLEAGLFYAMVKQKLPLAKKIFKMSKNRGFRLLEIETTNILANILLSNNEKWKALAIIEEGLDLSSSVGYGLMIPRMKVTRAKILMNRKPKEIIKELIELSKSLDKQRMIIDLINCFYLLMNLEKGKDWQNKFYQILNESGIRQINEKYLQIR